MSLRPASTRPKSALPAGNRPFGSARAQADAWWTARTPRERRLLRAGGLFIGLALSWAFALKPALDSIAHSRDQLPRLRAQAVQVDAYILEAQALQRRQSGQIDPAALPEALRDDLRRAGLDASTSVAIDTLAERTDEQGWTITLTDAGAAQVMDWLAGLPYRLHLRIHSVELARSRVDGRDRPGHVSGRIMLLPPQEGTP